MVSGKQQSLHTRAARPRPADGLRETDDIQWRGEVDDIQRARIVSAMVEVASELGYTGATVACVVTRAGVSRRTFYELFDGREDCFLATFEWSVAQMRRVLARAYRPHRSWREGARHAVAALLLLLDSEPGLARTCVVEALAAGKLVLERRAQVLRELAEALDAGAPAGRGLADVSPLSAEGAVGGAFSIVHGRLLEGDSAPGRLIDLHGQLMALVVLPYLGPRAAGQELTSGPPPVVEKRAVGEEVDGRLLLERFTMRLTYRTVRCLMFIGEHPGASNRQVAAGADVSDEGQASKLLGRLAKLDLIANSRAPGPGQANRWTLTPHGEQALSAMRGFDRRVPREA
jgi:AcrR family transcriptional regulator/DNA-binding MarR family transcriptional regulator